DTRAAFARRANRDQYRRWCSGDQHPPVVQRLSNQQLWRAGTDKGYFSTNQQYLTALEGLIDSEGSSVSVGLDNFFAALSEASSTPESIALRQQIIGEAKQLAQR